MKKMIVLAICLFAMPICVHGQEDYSKYSGYVDLGELTEMNAPETSVEVYLKKPLLKLLAAANTDDQDLQELLKGLAMVRVEVYEISGEQVNNFEKLIKKISKKLDNKNWDRLVKAKDAGEHVEIFIKMTEEKVEGLLVMALENDEASFVNVVGDLNLEMMGKLGASFDIPNLDKISTQKEEKKE